ncbi:MAG: DUF3857 domain-containing protein [Myxococcaceae bacterium]
MGPLLALALVVTTADPAFELPELSEVPAWVKPLEVPPPPSADGAPTRILVRDFQMRVTAATVERYYHYASTALTSAGIDAVAHHSFEFDPSFQQIQIHGLWRWRNGQRSSVWVREDVRVLQRESKLEERIYDGSLSLAIEVRDVRVGDVVEVAWTEAGDNPVFDGNFTETYDTRYLGRTSRAGFRLVWERPVPPSFRAHNGAPLPNETRQGAAREYAWRADDLEPLTLDRNLPGDVDPWPFVELSTWESWGQVARWADGLFKVEDPGPLLRAELARLPVHMCTTPKGARRAISSSSSTG